LPTPIREARGGGFKDVIEQVSKRLDTTVVNAYTRRKRHQRFKDLIKQASKRLDTIAANAYTTRRRRTIHQGGGGRGIKDLKT
jgi:hypothetical protein